MTLLRQASLTARWRLHGDCWETGFAEGKGLMVGFFVGFIGRCVVHRPTLPKFPQEPVGLRKRRGGENAAISLIPEGKDFLSGENLRVSILWIHGPRFCPVRPRAARFRPRPQGRGAGLLRGKWPRRARRPKRLRSGPIPRSPAGKQVVTITARSAFATR